MSKTEKEVMEKEKHPLHIVDQEIGEFKATQKIAKEFEAIITMMEILNRSWALFTIFKFEDEGV